MKRDLIIFIKLMQKMLFLLGLFLIVLPVQVRAEEAPKVEIKGIVRDARTKAPVNAAQVILTNKASVITGEDGTFTVDIGGTDGVLHVEAFEYERQEIAVFSADQFVEVNLYPKGFYNYFKPIRLPHATVDNSALTISAKSTENFSQNTDVTADTKIQTSFGSDLRSVSRSGLIGSGNNLFIRGINSLYMSTQPLVVVDGVIWNSYQDLESIHAGLFINPLDDIDVNDIEDITIMKDGTSIYGAKGANGVVLITTKRSKSMVTKIGLNVFYGILDRPAQIPLLSSEEYRIYASDMLTSYKVATGEDVSADFLANPNNPIYNAYFNNTNWSDLVYQTGNVGNYVVNVDGGDDRAMYYFSIGLTNSDGAVKTTDYQRLNARFNVDANFTKFLKTKAEVSFTNNIRTLLDDGVDRFSSPTWQAQIKSPFLSPYLFSSTGVETKQLAYADEFGIANPVGVINYSQNKQKKQHFNIGIAPELTILPVLKFTTQFNYSLQKIDEAYFLPMNYTPERIMPLQGISKNNLKSQVANNNSIYSDSRLIYNQSFNNHNLNAVAGFRYSYNSYEVDFIDEHNSGSNSNTMITGAYEFLTVDGFDVESKYISNYLGVDYDFQKKYLVSAAFAMDASSRFGKQARSGISLFGASWGLFPSINGAWVFSSEEFMRPVSMINYGKLRLGYGITGNDAIPDYEAQTYLTSTRFTNRANGLRLAHFENEEIQWEQTRRANAGLDLEMFRNIVNISLDVYTGTTDNLLTLIKYPEVLGSGYYWYNNGSMINQGFEASLNLKMLNLKNFIWNLGLSAGHYNNKITSLQNPEGYFVTPVFGSEVITQKGQPLGLFYGYKSKGVISTQEEADALGLKQIAKSGGYDYFMAGDIQFDDVNKDGIIDERDKQVIGNPHPKLYGAINSNMKLHRFDLSLLFTYSYGNDVYNYHRRMLETGSDFSNQSKARLNRWTADGQQTSQPQAIYGDPMGNGRFSDRWIEDGSYLKLKNVKLSYVFAYKNDYIRGINIWASVNDVYTLTNYLGRDPEFSISSSPFYQGIDAGFMPNMRAYYLGLRIDF